MIDLWRRDEVAASLPVAERIVEDHPTSFEAHENLAEIHADQGNSSAAVEHAVMSLALHPGNGDAFGVLAEVCGDDVIDGIVAAISTGAEWQAAADAACRSGVAR